MKFHSLLFYLLLVFTAVVVAPAVSVQAQALTIYQDALGANWQNYSWAAVDLQAGPPVNSGNHSIAVTYSGWDGLYLHHPGLETGAFSRVRFFAYGGSGGGQLLQLYAVYVDGSSGPAVALPPLPAGNWSEMQVPLADLAAANRTITGFVWQGRSGGPQPTFYLDDVALLSDESPDGPAVSQGSLQPRAARADGVTQLVVRARVAHPQGAAHIKRVTLDATALGRGLVELRDDGLHHDGAANDGLYGARLTVAPGTPPAETMLQVTAEDTAGRRASLPLGAFVTLAPPGGALPAGLPPRLGWGTNEWSESAGADWQVNSGVPWDYVYQYITYDWYVNGWGGNFVGRFVQQAWQKNYVPVVSVYLMLGVPPDCGESAACYAQKLQNPSTVTSYLAALAQAAQQAQGSQSVIFHLEPDFYGFMQQLSHRPDRPPGVQPDDPASYPVALNLPGYENNLAGFGRRIVDVIRAEAPNALVAPHASMWATDQYPADVPADQVASLAQRTAAFLGPMGGDQADLYFVEWSDRDAGSGLRPWWDDDNLTLPRPARAVLWANALSQAAGKRLGLWQIPVGNMDLDDTCNRYRDNRVAYIAGHSRDLADAGIVALLFGPGMSCMTRASTDGGFLAGRAAVVYAPPATPTGLTAVVQGAAVHVRWQENEEPDLWGYRLSYGPAGGGTSLQQDTRRAHTALLLPGAGEWQIQVAAYDALGNYSPISDPVVVMVHSNAAQTFLPFVQRAP
jgi:hypothetical protein